MNNIKTSNDIDDITYVYVLCMKMHDKCCRTMTSRFCQILELNPPPVGHSFGDCTPITNGTCGQGKTDCIPWQHKVRFEQGDKYFHQYWVSKAVLMIYSACMHKGSGTKTLFQHMACIKWPGVSPPWFSRLLSLHPSEDYPWGFKLKIVTSVFWMATHDTQNMTAQLVHRSLLAARSRHTFRTSHS